jgi:hypothetical protein
MAVEDFATLVRRPPDHSVPCLIGPVLAKLILANEFRAAGNLHQRSVKQGHVRTLADRMSDGRWKHPAEPLLITSKDESGENAGMVANDQHRLHAVILADKAIMFDVGSALLPRRSASWTRAPGSYRTTSPSAASRMRR